MRALFKAARRKIAHALEKSETAIQTLIGLNLAALAIETLPNLTATQQAALAAFETATVALFTLEYLTRWAISRPRLAYGMSWTGLIDLAAILPYYIAAGLDLRAIRAMRFMRIFWILKTSQFGKAMRKYQDAFRETREEFIICGTAAAAVLYISSLLIWHFENPVQPDKFSSVFTSMWWTLCTITTVGYGDVYPVTAMGRILTSVVLLAGIGLVSVSSGLLAAALAAHGKNQEQ